MIKRDLAIHIERQIDQLCDQFEQQLQLGCHPHIEHYLSDVPAIGRNRLLLELLMMTVEYAGRAPHRILGPLPMADAYRARSMVRSADKTPSPFQGSGTPPPQA